MTNSELSRNKKFAKHSEKLLPCPFCGGAAEIEEVQMPFDISNYSVGCLNEDCMGYQSTTLFARRFDAAMAWNKRA